MLASGPVEQGFEFTWGRVLALFFPCSFFPILKPIRFFRFSDVVICCFLVWSDSVRTAAAVVIMYRFKAVPHVVYSNAINNVLVNTAVYSSRTPDERVRTLSSLFLCFCVLLFLIVFLGG